MAKQESPRKSVPEEAKERLQLAIDSDNGNRQAAHDDLQFAAGDQWPDEIKMARQLDRRPCLTINKTDTFVLSVVNNMRQQRPRIKVHPVSDGADEGVSNVIEGLIRHIEVSSNADSAYDTAADSQVRMGWGYWRVLGKYADETSWEQDLCIERIRNPFSVYFDPGSVTPDGSDAEWAIIVEPMKKSEFEKLYPKAKVSDFKTGDSMAGYAEKREWPGKYIPIIPVYGAELLDGERLIRYGMVRNLKDPQKMYNFWRSQETEFAAMAPKAPWLMAEGQDEGHEEEWDTANTKNYSSLKYKPIADDAGQTLPPPMRQPPQAIPAASVNAAMGASEDLKSVAGMFDPALGAPGQETSGTMVQRRQQQSDLSNFHFYDNLTRSIRWTGIILLDLIPHYYDTPRTIRIIGEDGNPTSTQINTQTVDKVLNDLTVGRYDVVMDTGPGYDTKRMEASSMMMDMLRAMPDIAKIAGDLIVRQMDWPGADTLADRLAMANPLAQVDKQLPPDMDPKAKQMLAQLMGQNQQLQQQLQQLQQEKAAKVFGVQEREQAVTQRELGLTKMREDAETHRLHVRELGEHERAELESNTRIHDTHLKNATSFHETLIDAHTNLAIAHQKALQQGVPNTNKPTSGP